MPPKAESGHQILAGDVNLSDARLRVDSGVKKHVITAKPPTGGTNPTVKITS